MKTSFSQSLETTANILCKDFGLRVITQGNRFKFEPATNTIYLPDIKEELDVVKGMEEEKNSFLGGALHEVAHKKYSDIKFLAALTKKLQKAKGQTALRLLTLLSFYQSMEDIRVEKMLAGEYDGAHSLLTWLNDYVENENENIVPRQIKKCHEHLQKEGKLDPHVLRLLSFLLSCELYTQMRYKRQTRELKQAKNDKYESIEIVRKMSQEIIKDEKLKKMMESIEDIRTPLEMAREVNKIFHRTLRKHYSPYTEEDAKKEEEKKQKIQVIVQMPAPEKGEGESQEGQDAQSTGQGNDGEGDGNQEEEQQEMNNGESKEGGGKDEDHDDEGAGDDEETGEGYDEDPKPTKEEEEKPAKEEEEPKPAKEEKKPAKENKYDFSDKDEEKAEKELDEAVKEAEDRPETEEVPQSDDDKYQDKMYSMFINMNEATPEQFDTRQLILNSRTIIKYFGKDMKGKIVFPPVRKHDAVIDVGSVDLHNRLMKDRGWQSTYKNEKNKEEFFERLKNLDKVIFDLKHNVFLKLLARKKILPRIDQTEGFIDGEALASYKINPRIYYDLKWKKRFDTSVSVLCDLSGSMAETLYDEGGNEKSSSKVMMMCEVMYILSQINQAFGIPTEVTGFNAGPWFTKEDGTIDTYNLTDEMLMVLAKEGMYGDLSKYYRFAPVNHFVLKGFRDNFEKIRANIYRFYSVLWAGNGGCNVDNEAIEFATQRLLSMPNKRKILLIVADGQPNPPEASNFNDSELNIKAVKLQEKMGKKTFIKAAPISARRRRYGRYSSPLPKPARSQVKKSTHTVMMEAREHCKVETRKVIAMAARHVEVGYISLGDASVISNWKEEVPNMSKVIINKSKDIAPKILELLEGLLLKGEF